MSPNPVRPTKNSLRPRLKWLLIGVTIFLIVLILLFIGLTFYNQHSRYGFFIGVKINGQPAEQLTQAQAVDYWQSQVDNYLKIGPAFIYQGQTINIAPTTAANNPDAATTLANYDVPATVDQAYLYGRQNGYFINTWEQIKALIFGENIALKLDFKQAEFLKILKNHFDQYATPVLNARPEIDKELNVTVGQEQAGQTFDYQAILKETFANLQTLSPKPIELVLKPTAPTLLTTDVTATAIAELKTYLSSSTLRFYYQDQNFIVPREEYKNWLGWQKSRNKIAVTLNEAVVSDYLNQKIASVINVPIQDAKFNIKNGKVQEFQGSRDGLALDIEKTMANLNQAFINNRQTQIELIVNKQTSQVTAASLNDLGINEIIGTGHSNFKGSPKNRRHNIATGAKAVNGTLIKPGETFSLVNTLGDISSSTGYLPELVIKGDKTTPEYGGGLCQIGTTVFRGALASGLPIVERRNHSYRVSYYEPAGTDATIYDPKPDLRFTNDTGKYILIQSRIKNDDLYFDFWGTPDGRLATQTKPVIYNIKPAGDTIITETADLKPGEKKCTETAHNGADAYFDYTVTYANSEIKKVRFSSHYIPWPARCLVGIDPNAVPPVLTPTSTPPLQ